MYSKPWDVVGAYSKKWAAANYSCFCCHLPLLVAVNIFMGQAAWQQKNSLRQLVKVRDGSWGVMRVETHIDCESWEIKHTQYLCNKMSITSVVLEDESCNVSLLLAISWLGSHILIINLPVPIGRNLIIILFASVF